MPKMLSAPAASNDLTRLCAPVIWSLISLWFLICGVAAAVGIAAATKNPPA